MALIFPGHRIVVMQVPKTGCIWRGAALARALGVEPGRPPHLDGHDRRHATADQLPEAALGLPRVAFVRRPDRWLASYWAMRMRLGNWHPTWPTWLEACLDRDCRDATFEGFARKMLARHSGLISRVFESYAGTPDAPAAFVGRAERLVDDACAALGALGVAFDEDALRSTPPRNEGDRRWKRAATLPDGLRADLLASEPATARWYADDRH